MDARARPQGGARRLFSDLARPRVRLGAALAICLFAAQPALASPTQESFFQDDDLLVYNTPAGTARTLDQLRALGVRRVRISVFWRVVAPDPLSRRRPQFDASDPGAYGAQAWDRYDRAIELAHQRGIAVNLNITSPAPLWATQTPDRADIANIYYPSPREFGAFVTATARRYSGNYTPGGRPAGEPAPPPPQPQGSGGLFGGLLGPTANAAGAGSGALPRVDSWAIWNEPNQGGWLAPQWVGAAETAPALYRGLVDAGWAALASTGHAGDTIMIGETAPKGLNVRGETRSIKPLPFIRALYCVDGRLVPLRGNAARARGCPATRAASASFPAEHPGLFEVSGWAHHPYELTFRPDRAPRDPDFVTIANLHSLERTLARIRSHYGQPGALPLFLTEFGYATNPPNPAGVSLAQQAAYLNESEFIAYRDPLVRAVAQFLLDDSPPLPGRNGVTVGYGATFQTGLRYHAGGAKPSLDAYRMPIWLPSPIVRRHRRLRVWGLVRTAPRGVAQTVAIEFRSRRRGRFRQIGAAVTAPDPAYLDARVAVPGSGELRLAWRAPGTTMTLHSRMVRTYAARRR